MSSCLNFWWMNGMMVEWMVHILLGDHFAIAAFLDNEKNVDFYIFVCNRKAYTCKTTFVCKWGEEFKPEDLVLECLYYQKYGLGVDMYVLLRKSQRGHILAYHVCAMKFPMLLCDHRVFGSNLLYKLQIKMEEAILEQAWTLSLQKRVHIDDIVCIVCCM